MILLDTNVLSELTKPTPSVQVVTWLAVNEPSLAVPTIALAEVRYGISARLRSSAFAAASRASTVALARRAVI